LPSFFPGPGIGPDLIVFVVFCIMGFLTGLAAVVSTGCMNPALSRTESLFGTDAIAACESNHSTLIYSPTLRGRICPAQAGFFLMYSSIS
jgi:ABC-type xylose transport system permease subunit